MLSSKPARSGLVMALLAIAIPAAAHAQTLTATVSVGTNPYAVAVNPVTNRIYVANGDGTVTVLDGAHNTTVSVGSASGYYSVAVNPVANKIYVSNAASSSVTVIDGNTNNTHSVTAGSNPRGVAVNPITNKIYVTNAGSANVTVIDGTSDTVSATVTVGVGPNAVAVNQVTNQIYVADGTSGAFTVIDGGSDSAKTFQTGATSPTAVAVNPVTNRVYVANYNSNNVTVINGADNSFYNLAVGSNPTSVAVNPVTDRIYVANSLSGNVTVIDGTMNTSPVNVSGGYYPVSLAVNPVTNKIYAAGNGGSEVVIDGATNTVTPISTPGLYPTQVAVNPVTNKAYVTNYGSNTVTVIDGATYDTANFTTGSGAIASAVNPVTKTVYVANESSNSVSIFNFATDTFAGVNTDSQPVALAVNPATNTVYVANEVGNSVTIIDGASNNAATIPVGKYPFALAVNPVTNKVYVANSGNNTVSVLDGGVDNNAVTLSTGTYPVAVAVNPATNKIYVANQSSNSVTVINGQDNSTVNIAVQVAPVALTVNPITNMIYVANSSNGLAGSISVIDGSSNMVVATVPAGNYPSSIGVNPITNRVYVSKEYDSTVTVLDAVANTVIATVQAGNYPASIAVNPVTNKIYVGDLGSIIQGRGRASVSSGNLTVIDGSSNSVTSVGVGGEAVGLAINPITNQTFLVDGSSTLTAVTEQQTQPIPLVSSVGVLTNNRTPDSNPLFNFYASSSFSPAVTTPDQLLFQADTWQNEWGTGMYASPAFKGTLPYLQPGFHIVYAFAGDGQHATSTQTGSPLIGTIAAYGFLVYDSANQQAQTVTFINLPTSGGVGSTITLSASAQTPVTFSSASSFTVCYVTGNMVTLTGTGTCTVTATAAQSSTYQAATTSQNITVLPGQSITFGTIPQQQENTTLTLSASASSGLPVTFTSGTTTFCTVSGSTATLLAAGTCTIQATQPGDDDYAAATPVSQSFTVTTRNGLGFVPVAPCRLVDTRTAPGSLGGPGMAAGSTRSFPLPMGSCGLPSTASAYSLNVTVVPKTKLSYLTLWPTGEPQPVVSTLNSLNGRVVANAAIVPAGTNGDVNVYVTDQTDVIIDVNGYFGDANSSGALTFVPLVPCRVEDTRSANGPLGGPILSAGSSRSFPVPSSGCGAPASALAYSLNATVVPTSVLHYLTLYPAGTSQPGVSTLNSYNGQVVANAAIVRAGTSGAVDAYVTDQTNLITDINGYFTSSPPTPLVFNAVTPCRVVDTRQVTGSLGGPIMAANSTRTFPIPASSCGIPPTATAYALNVTVVPSSALNYLTLWPAGESKPTVSTLNSPSGQIVANGALVPAGTSGSVEVFVTDQTHLLIDIVGYFSAL